MNDEVPEVDIPDGIGPHEARELELMLAGMKPMAMFCGGPGLPVSDFYPEPEFMIHVRDGSIIRRDETYDLKIQSAQLCHIYYALPHETWRIDRMHEIHSEFARTNIWSEAHDREVGQLLGYSESQITAFLGHARPHRRD